MDIKSKFFQEESEEFPWNKEALEKFKELINEKGIKCRMDNVFLHSFLRAKNFDQDMAIRLLENYYNYRCKHPIYFKDLLPSKLQKILSLNIMHFMPKPDQDGRYIFIIRLANLDLNITNYTEYVQTILLFMDFQLNFYRLQEKGVVLIINAEGITMRHLLESTPEMFYSLLNILFGDYLPIRFQSVHYVNMNAIMKAVLSFTLPLFPENMKGRSHLDSGSSELHKFVHPEYLPVEYGGKLPSFDSSEMNAMIIENEEYFRMNESFLKLYQQENDKKKLDGLEHLNEDNGENQSKNNLKLCEEIFKRIQEDPENYISRIDSEFPIPC